MSLFHTFVSMLQREAEKKNGSTVIVDGQALPSFMSTDYVKRADVKGEILSKLKDVNLFTLSRTAVFPGSQMIGGPSGPSVAVVQPNQLDLDVAPPFQTCWIQFSEGERMTGVTSGNDTIFAVFLHERGPHRYAFAIVQSDQDGDADFLRLRVGHCSPDENHDIWHNIALFLQPFNRKSITAGIERTNDRVKYKTRDGEKHLLKIRKIVHIRAKKVTGQEIDEHVKAGRKIDWSHRFEVRGHWRKHNGIGKNRAGDYCVEGSTYVIDYQKGPEEAPLVKKTRVVVGDEQA